MCLEANISIITGTSFNCKERNDTTVYHNETIKEISTFYDNKWIPLQKLAIPLLYKYYSINLFIQEIEETLEEFEAMLFGGGEEGRAQVYSMEAIVVKFLVYFPKGSPKSNQPSQNHVFNDIVCDVYTREEGCGWGWWHRMR